VSAWRRLCQGVGRHWYEFRRRVGANREVNRRWANIVKANYGRDAGWYVERRGQRIAMVIDCRFVEMFWDSYLLVALTDDIDLRQRLRMDAFWNHVENEGVVFRNRECGELAKFAIPARNPLREFNRIVMRGLYLWKPTMDCEGAL
jgi:hypothetical protein